MCNCTGRNNKPPLGDPTPSIDGPFFDAVDLRISRDDISADLPRGEFKLGETATSCTHECVEPKTVTCNEGLRTMCDDYDGDGCFEWGNPAPCPGNSVCADGHCPCVPECDDQACGDDGCGGTCNPCAEGKICVEGECVDCQSGCKLKACGLDLCGGSCGICAPGLFCSPGGHCSDKKCSCQGAECGSPAPGCDNLCGDGPLDGCHHGYKCDLETVEDPETHVCELCTPDCQGKECGPNGCGGLCGVCPSPSCCQPGFAGTYHCCGLCEPSVNCWGKECGPSGCLCWDTNFCESGCLEMLSLPCGQWGECPEGQECKWPDGRCVPCTSCGACLPSEYCSHEGLCLAKQGQCADKECGSDGEGGNCGICPPGKACAVDSTCKPSSDPCEERECGPDGHGGICGECGVGQLCDYGGKCTYDACHWNCAGRECGPNGCGGSCGGCGAGESCDKFGYCES